MTMQTNDQHASTEQSSKQAATAINSDKPALIASRQRCEADGVGLSHYILMDQKKAAE
jgi:modified peptide precursor CbpA